MNCSEFLRALCAVFLLASAARGETPKIDFSRDILPILSDNCFHCHGPDEKGREADLRLDQHEAVVADRGGYHAVVPGSSDASELIKRLVTTDDDARMPPPDSNRKLTPEQVDLLKRWVDEGASWGQHWAWVPPQRPSLPAVQNTDWGMNPIDRFVLARLEREAAAGQPSLGPAPEASKETLIRRVTLDLTGLPPTPEEVDAFLADASPMAYERVVDRLLSSPRYGERMVWDWLDAARYADTNGYQGDQTRTMWPWRDWAVQALNSNMPFDQFTIEQLAGDQLPNATREQKIATGFSRNHMINGEGGRIPEENRVEYVFDQLETTATVWLGATFNCCRCHDHKFDPFTQRDYYGLFGFFNNTPVDGGGGSGQTAPVVEYLTAEEEKLREALNQRVLQQADATDGIERRLFPREEGKTAADSPQAASFPDDIKNKLRNPPANRGAADDAALHDRFKIVDAAKPAEEQANYAAYAEALQQLRAVKQERDGHHARIPRVMVMEDRPDPRETFILDKGLYNKPLGKTTTALPAVLTSAMSMAPATGATAPPPNATTRLELARWLVSPEHPLTARVTVNRLWQQLFGLGLVKTADDFGVQGEKPSHPELLDWLAVELRESGWNVKHMQRLMVTSSTYRQASQARPEFAERDPDNRLLARGSRYRLPVSMLRDQALAASGLLSGAMGGPGVNPYQPAGVWEETSFGNIRYAQDHGENLYRRSVYTFWRRIVAPTLFFDSASRQVCSVKHIRTNTPLHALTTLNDITFVEAARVLAERAMLSAPSAEERVTLAFRLVLGRSPQPAERAVLLASLERQRGEFTADVPSAKQFVAVGEHKRSEKLGGSDAEIVEHAAYAGVCLAILNLDEALSKE
jgi:hypothetical protein